MKITDLVGFRALKFETNTEVPSFLNKWLSFKQISKHQKHVIQR